MRAVMGLGLVFVLALAGCAAQPGDGPVPSASPSATGSVHPGTLEPGAALIGLWSVHAAGEAAGTFVVFSATGFTVERDRRLVNGGWGTGDDQLAAQVVDWDGGLKDPAVPWLTGATSFTMEGDQAQLHARDGAVTATLTRASRAPAPRNALAELMDPPTLAPADDARFRVAAPPTAGPPITAEQLLGTWVTGHATAPQTLPFLTWKADGTYTASDGCNGAGGAWRLLSGGRLLTTSGASTAIGCDNNVPVQAWLAFARSAALVKGRLTLFDGNGKRLGSFTRR